MGTVPACHQLGYCSCEFSSFLESRSPSTRMGSAQQRVYTRNPLAGIKAQNSHINPVILPSCGEWFGHPSQCQGNVTALVAGRSHVICKGETGRRPGWVLNELRSLFPKHII